MSFLLLSLRPVLKRGLQSLGLGTANRDRGGASGSSPPHHRAYGFVHGGSVDYAAGAPGAASALKERERDDREDEIARLKSKVGEITMDNELLSATPARETLHARETRARP